MTVTASMKKQTSGLVVVKKEPAMMTVKDKPHLDMVPLNLHEKLLVLQSRVTTIGKSGYNSFHKYEYVTVNDIMASLRPALQELGLQMFSGVSDYKVSDTDASCRVIVTLTDVDNPEDFITFSGVGYAKDAKGDKALFKAQTGAFKYALLLGFSLDTDSIDEPENTSNEQVKGRVGTATAKKRRTTDDDDLDI